MVVVVGLFWFFISLGERFSAQDTVISLGPWTWLDRVFLYDRRWLLFNIYCNILRVDRRRRGGSRIIDWEFWTGQMVLYSFDCDWDALASAGIQ